MKKVLLVVIVTLLPFTVGFRVYWSPVTTYTDNTAIEPANLPAMYDVWQDGVQIANGTTATNAPLTDNTKGKTSTYTARARLANGALSDNVVVTLKSPLGVLNPPAAGWSVGN